MAGRYETVGRYVTAGRPRSVSDRCHARLSADGGARPGPPGAAGGAGAALPAGPAADRAGATPGGRGPRHPPGRRAGRAGRATPHRGPAAGRTDRRRTGRRQVLTQRRTGQEGGRQREQLTSE